MNILQSIPIAERQLHYTLYDKYDDFNFAIVNFPIEVAIYMYNFHLLIVGISPSWFDTQARFKARSTTIKKLISQGHNESRLISSFRKSR
jgi:hypothetical protein